jgi:3-methyl-2-oxobutanoate hydroxymethyltransferase
MGDMPFLSYQADDERAILNAGRFMTEGLADLVKVEADASFAPLVSKMSRAGIPVCGHVGSKPQHSAKTGGYVSSGKTASSAERIVQDAIELERAGCVLLLVEAVPAEVAEAILERTTVPLIGIGAGPACHGQILVLQDLLGMTSWQPGFASAAAHLGEDIEKHAREWVETVARRQVTDHRYEMNIGESKAFKG